MEPGELIDHYRLVSLVGAGGMGEVYRAVDERLRRDVAIKVLPHSRSSADRDTRLLREAQAASSLNHPGIVTIHDVGRWHDRTYIVMELVDGRRLSELAAGAIPAAQAVSLCRLAAEAMGVAHERGILHRDIKPDNLMVTRDQRVKILDFGVAKLYDPEASVDTPLPAPPPPLPEPVLESSDALEDTLLSPPRTPATISVTRTGALLGTPAYMSPEQAAGASVDERSEVYSLGLVLYELLTGIRPLQRATLIDTLAAAREPAIRPPSQAVPARAIPRACDRLVGRALAREPFHRHPTMRALANDLSALEESLAARPRRRWPILALATAGLAGAGAAAFALRPQAGSSQPAAAAPFQVTAVRRLTFDPGCEELPSFWPDGNSVVFDGVVEGDTEVVRLDLATGARQRVTRRPGWDIGAAVSPDGRWIAFLSFTDRGRELMVQPWDPQGAGEPRSHGLMGGYPSWAADGHLLFGDGQSGIVRMDPAGQERRLFASTPGYVTVKAEEMADGEVLLALRHAGQNPARMVLARTRGDRVDLVGGAPPTEEVVIARDAAGRGFYVGEPTETGPRLVWRSLDGRERHELSGLPFPHGGMAVDRSGRRLVLSNCGQLFRVGRIEGGRFEPLFDGRDWNDTNLVAVGDGSYVFATDRSGPSEIWGGRPGEAPRRVIAEPASSPAVSRDGQELAWVGDTPTSRGIYLSRRTDGTLIRRLTDEESDDRPVFSRDGTAIYFVRGGPAGARIFRVLAAGGDPAPVSDGGVVGFDLSPDDRLAILVQDDHGRHLVQGRSGGPFTRLRTLPDGNYTELAYSGDGATLWVARGASEIVELRSDGSSKPRVVWQTTNDLVSFIAADGDGLIADVATYVGDLYLVDGQFR